MKARGVLVKVRGGGEAFAQAAAKSLGAAKVEKILAVPPRVSSVGVAPEAGATWFRIGAARDVENAWDRAHDMVAARSALGVAGADQIISAEPDYEQEWIFEDQPPPAGEGLAASKSAPCAFDPQNGTKGRALGHPDVGWSTGDQFSELTKAAARVGNKQTHIVIAHLDTGFDPRHDTRPVNLDLTRQRNFVPGGQADSAEDVSPAGLLNNPGHGPATLGLLAGGKMNGNVPQWVGYTADIGGAPLAMVVPIRIADSVVHFTTSSMAMGFDYATSIGAHVLTMSMGGLSSDLLTDAVNLAYDNGVFMVTAAGNSYSWVLMPSSIVFPARYRRVVAACGVMADGRPYWGLDFGTMQGNFGPPSKMDTALGAYTPNVAWAERGCPDMVDMDGGGTSAATPQIAAAAALWLAEYWDTVKDYPPWARVEAVRAALFGSASKSTPMMGADETRQKLGQGVLRADAALSQVPLPVAALRQLPRARPSWSWLDLLTEGGVSFGPKSRATERQLPMLRLELTQMAQRFAALELAMTDPDRDREAKHIPVHERNHYLERALEEGHPSEPLRLFLEHLLGRKKAAPNGEPKSAPLVRRRQKDPPLPRRRLRVYSLDPSLAQSNDFFAVNQTTLSLPWDDEPGHAMSPGPVGEYLEVVDVDPASNKVYAPVDLNDGMLLAQDGLTPSEGNPKFHQQMVYAVGMLTIGTFERALGRKAMWAPRVVGRKQVAVHRLRIYPHALRAENAYYSPERRAILFGYFQAAEDSRGLVAPGSMVFTCLSSDIIAHEMSHALLDGLHRRFIEVSNPDVPAFHEAFADIVAIFQHFTYKNLVRFEISRAKGKLTAASLLGGLAMQFGHGSGRSGPLRNYSDPTKDTRSYENTPEAHDRGSILVFAIYDAFLKIVARRTADLIRLATGGTGILRPGALHPDLVERLANETCKTARHFLNICIRALDYCPAVDITFGEYLRGLVTADVDAVPEDPWGYRVALIEAFRNRGIVPRDIKTVSEETLTWNTTYFDRKDSGWLKDAVRDLDLGWNLDMDRSDVYAVNEENRWTFWRALNKALKANSGLMKHFGLQPDLPRYDDKGKVMSSRNRDAATTFEVYGVWPARRIAADGSFLTELVAVIHQRQPLWYDETNHERGWFWFRGGATIIIDPRPGHEAVRYSIIKNSASPTRQARQRKLGSELRLSPLGSLYFGAESEEPFAIVHNKLGGY